MDDNGNQMNSPAPSYPRELSRRVAWLAAFIPAMTTAMTVLALGGLFVGAGPPRGLWPIVVGITFIAALIGHRIAGRVSPDVPPMRRYAAAMLLGGIAQALIPVGAYLLSPIDISPANPILGVLGPAAALLFFPGILVAMGPRFALASAPGAPNRGVLAIVLGVVTGSIVVAVVMQWAGEPIAAIAVAAVLTLLSGLFAFHGVEPTPNRRRWAGMIVGTAAAISLYFGFWVSIDFLGALGSV